MVWILSSPDPDLSFAVGKNPASNPFLHPHAQGCFLSWYQTSETSQSEFHTIFRDLPNRASYTRHNGQSGDYLDHGYLTAPQLTLAWARDVIRSSAKVKQVPYRVTISQYALREKERNRFLVQNFQEIAGLEIEIKRISSELVFLSFSTEVLGLVSLLRLIEIFAWLSMHPTEVQKNLSLGKKFGSYLETIALPYWLRKTLLSSVIDNLSEFEQLAPHFEVAGRERFQYGNNFDQRRAFVREVLLAEKSEAVLIDFGCGDFKYGSVLKRLPHIVEYHGIEIDPQARERANLQARRLRLEERTTFHESWSSFAHAYQESEEKKRTILLCTEVFEHLLPTEAKLTGMQLVQTLQPDQILITVPDRRFNQFYLIPDERKRHPDHQWEPDELQFLTFLWETFPQFEVTLRPIGDIVLLSDDYRSEWISPTLGAILTPLPSTKI